MEKCRAFAFEMHSLNHEFWSQQIRAFDQKVILQYNVYVILCFLHLLLKYDCVGVYNRFENLFKTFFVSNFVNCSLLSAHKAKIFLVVFDTMHPKDDSEEYCGFYHHSYVGA